MATAKKTPFIRRETVLLTKELKQKVEKQIRLCNAKAKELWNIDVEMPEVRSKKTWWTEGW